MNEKRMRMTASPPTIEEQLRRYADAIDPSINTASGAAAATETFDDPMLRPRPEFAAASLVPFEEAGRRLAMPRRALVGALAAVALLITLVGVALFTRTNPADVALESSIGVHAAPPVPAADEASSSEAESVESGPTIEFADHILHTIGAGDTMSELAAIYGTTVEAILQANAMSSPHELVVGDTLVVPLRSGPSPFSDEPFPLPSGYPIFWPDGTTDVAETVEKFLDQFFPAWRAGDLGVFVAPGQPDVPESGSTANAMVLRPDGVFASVELRFADGRWFLWSIESPELQVEAVIASGTADAEPKIVGSFWLDRPGIVEIEVFAPFERRLVGSRTVTVTGGDVATWQPFEVAPGHQQLHVRLTSPEGELLAIHAATPAQSPMARPPAPALPAEIETPDAPSSRWGLGCEGGGCGAWLTREEELVVMLAELALLDECMAKRGEQFVRPTDDELVDFHGGWRANLVLGIGREAAASRLGYRDAGWGGAGSPSQSAVSDARSDAAQASYAAALSRCWDDVDAALRPDGPPALIANQLFGDGFAGESFLADPELAGVLALWRACVQTSVGIESGLPNDLARQFGAGPGLPTDQERLVAVADARCQRNVDLERAFYEARVRLIMNEDDERTAALRTYRERNLEMVLAAADVLTERSVSPPALD